MWCQRVAAGLIILLGSTATASAWGWQGHQVIGSIADRLLNDHARAQVKQLLPFDLRTAGPWADCAKSVKPSVEGSFRYTSEGRYRAACSGFETPSEIARMTDYVARNWDNCSSSEGQKGSYCHGFYHFTDVAIQHDHYDRRYIGTSNFDLVAAIAGAVDVLQGRAAPAPFSIKDKSEALLLLAHLMGDLHQPLHVGAIYLRPDGTIVDPDDGPFNKSTETRGGNDLLDGARNLHSEWDAIPKSLGTVASDELLDLAREIPKTLVNVEIRDYAARWAGDTINVAEGAFAGLSFTGQGPERWHVIFDDKQKYLNHAVTIKREQLVKGGAHLAELLNAIWP